jgi:hypothetical protein
MNETGDVPHTVPAAIGWQLVQQAELAVSQVAPLMKRHRELQQAVGQLLPQSQSSPASTKPLPHMAVPSLFGSKHEPLDATCAVICDTLVAENGMTPAGLPLHAAMMYCRLAIGSPHVLLGS